MNWQTVYQEWMNHPELLPNVKESLQAMETNQEELRDAFYQPLEFGTAGMRGIMAAGINRMNVYTVRQATEGLARFIDTLGKEAKERGVAIAFDSRHQSAEFATEAARVLAYHHINSYTFESLRPTPELSFAVRHLHCMAGIMITASHNPAAYNGYKVYGSDGGQMPPKDADMVTKFVREIEQPLDILVANDSVYQHIIGEEVDQAYLRQVASVSIDDTLLKNMADKVSIVYTPLHGTGKMLAEKALQTAGFKQVHLVPDQAEPDADFSTVRSPNPEEFSAFEHAIVLGEELQADLLVATDPDADRLGAVVRLPNGEYQALTGNQLGALMLHYILTAKTDNQTLPSNGVVLKSMVSSELARAICQAFSVELVDVLTGFKFIAEKIQIYEENQEKEFLFGFEESYGYLIKPFVRDKDAIQALLLLAEVTAYYKQQNKTLYDGLQEIFARYGYFKEKTISLTLTGIDGASKIEELMNQARQDSFSHFGSIPVAYVEDFLSQICQTTTGEQRPIALPKANVLKYSLADQSWVAIRPSGTEPKIKFYIGSQAASEAEADEKLLAIEETIQQFIAG